MTENAHASVDRFLTDFFGVRALDVALSRGLIDVLDRDSGLSADSLADQVDGVAQGVRMLADVLVLRGVLQQTEEAPCGYALTPAFRNALVYRDLMTAKIAFLQDIHADVDLGLGDLLLQPWRFHQRSRTFEIFCYDRALRDTPENRTATQRWLNYTTVLTRYESPILIDALDLPDVRRLLDVGGNSGAFAYAACQAFPRLKATVFDLPVVTALGQSYLDGQEGAERVTFQSGDVRRHALPGGHDLILFKSMLHDWTPDPVRMILEKAVHALPAGGRLAIAERRALSAEALGASYVQLTNLVFFSAYRTADLYRRILDDAGLTIVQDTTLDLDVPFILLIGCKR